MAETVEVIHYRDPDSSCEMCVFVDGVEVAVTAEVTIDPGAGYSRADWDQQRAEGLAGLSPSARALATRCFDSAEDKSEYIGG